MPQPTLVNLFGSGASYNSSTGILTVDLNSQKTDTGLVIGTAQPIEILASLIVFAAGWVENNTDQAVMATVSSGVFSPVNRNGADKTQYNINYQFYGAYQAPQFNADDLVS